MTMNISPLWGLRGLLLARELRRSEEEGQKRVGYGRVSKAGGGTAAANRNKSLPTYVRYSNASRNAHWESKRASPAWIVGLSLESSKHKALTDDTITLSPLCCRGSSSTWSLKLFVVRQ